jgi:hypothetical protein
MGDETAVGLPERSQNVSGDLHAPGMETRPTPRATVWGGAGLFCLVWKPVYVGRDSNPENALDSPLQRGSCRRADGWNHGNR